MGGCITQDKHTMLSDPVFTAHRPSAKVGHKHSPKGSGAHFHLPTSPLPPISLPDSHGISTVTVKGSTAEKGEERDRERGDREPAEQDELSGSSDSDSGSDSDDDSEDDDCAELSPERAKEIADATAALRVVHTHPVPPVRGILATSNARAGLLRPLSAAVIALRRKGLRFHVAEAQWSDRATALPIPRAAAAAAAASASPPPAAANGVSNAISRGVSPKHAGERWIGTKRKAAAASNTEAADSAGAVATALLSVPLGSSPAHSTLNSSLSSSGSSAIAPSPPASPSHINTSMSASSASSSSVAAAAAAPRQYTSSARVAGSSSFKARINQGSDRTSDTHSLTLSLSSSTTNLLLRLTPLQICNLNYQSLQLLFLFYSKAARNARDKAAEKEQRRSSKQMRKEAAGGGGGGLGSVSGIGSSHGSFSLQQHQQPQQQQLGQAFLSSVTAGASSASATASASASSASFGSSGGPAAASAAWVELDGSCPMLLEEMGVLALALVQKKLESFAKELALRDDVVAGRVKLTALLKAKRFNLFPGALTNGVLSEEQAHAEPQPSSGAVAAGAAGAASASAGVTAATPSPPPAPPFSLSEADTLDLFVRCTVSLLQARLGCNNFGELQWADVMTHWQRFASFYFLFRADTNPLGVPTTTHKNKQQHKCAIM